MSGVDVKESSDAAIAASRHAPARRKQHRRPQADADASTLLFHDLPGYLQDNEFIKAYYRAPDMPFKQTLRSLFDIHNETGNVWTHLLGFLLFAGLTLYVIALPPRPLALGTPQIDQLWLSVQGRVHGLADHLGQNLHQLSDALPHLSVNLHHLSESLTHRVDSLVHEVQEEVQQAAQALHERVHSLGDNLQHAKGRLNGLIQEALSDVLLWPVPRWPVYVFLAGAMTCLLLSAVCHLFGCCSQHVARLIWRFDYAGIAVLIVTSFYPPVYYGFLCQPYWRVFYLITTTAMGAGAVAMSLIEVFQRTEWRTFRASMFAALGLWGVVPLIHACMVHKGVAAVRDATALDVLMGVLYLVGATIYAARVPERWLPGRFDIWFHGHQVRGVTLNPTEPNRTLKPYEPFAYDFSRCYLGPRGLLPVLDALGADPAFASLSLANCGLGCSSVERLAGWIKVWESLRESAVDYLRGLSPGAAAQ
ncbi:ADIPOR-like receptor [Tetrabaena socialis]|uniref:ADIPOR-like receptor n=1 Tax=Tetrabaena socialis TaxID=47790 RepID=A0A2J8A6B3_9CHLO|nr:ADIPOR-like receptor [Tetrabaena socialis]|eukprot:PNH08040.1 ADIPOR-like receptor [Tetrabaena socialis]